MPNRIIKESICTSETIEKLSWFEEVFFYRLIVNCDDFGRLTARTEILKAKLFPLRDVSGKVIESTLKKLQSLKMLYLYHGHDDRLYLQIESWGRHQQMRTTKSKYPAPDITCNQMISDDINGNHLLLARAESNPIQSESNPNPESESNLYGDKPQEKNGRVFTPPTVDEVRAYVATRDTKIDPEMFHSFYTSKGWMVGKNKMKDWQGAVRTWERNRYDSNKKPTLPRQDDLDFIK